MAIKAAQIIHDANGFVVDRLQTGGLTNLNIPEERIRETGNFNTVGIIHDTPDLSFELESLDVSTEIEALMLGLDPTATVDGDVFDFMKSVPMDVISPFKAALGNYNIAGGIIVPSLNLETVVYRFGTRANATETFTMRGDSVFFDDAVPYYEEWPVAVGAGAVGPYVLSHAARPYTERDDDYFVLGVCWKAADGTYQRLFYGVDYTDTANDFTLLAAPPVGATLHAVYFSAAPASYDQTVHEDTTVKPAAVRGKDLDALVSDDGTEAGLGRWDGVQSFEATRRVTLDNDSEFGNAKYVAQDYDTPEVSGNIVIRARNVPNLIAKIRQVTQTPTGQVIGSWKSDPLPLELQVHHPDTGVRVKTLYVPDARFVVPAINARVATKHDTTFNFSSESGTLLVYSGERP